MIGFLLPGGEFEYDARGLLMSFFPGEELVMNPPEGEADWVITLPRVPEEGSKGQRKNTFKRLLYRQLSELTGKTLPWGTLTGIRPVRIVSDLLEAGYPPEEAAALFSRDYLVSEDEITESVQKLLSTIPEETDVFPGHMERTTIAFERQYNPLSMP